MLDHFGEVDAHAALFGFQVRFGSKADVRGQIRDVGFTPESGHLSARAAGR
jgi:hypothetical protein